MRGTGWLIGTVVSAPQQWWLLYGVRRGSSVGSCSLPFSGSGGHNGQIPTPTTPPLRTHTGAGDKPASVWWREHGQCWGSDVRHGVARVLGLHDQDVEDKGAKWGSRRATEA